MENRKLQSYEDMVVFLENLNNERKVINSQLSVMGISLFNDEIKFNKKRLKRRLKEMKHIFNYFDDLIKEYTTFDSDILLPFLAEYLSKNTDTKYINCRGEEAVWRGKYWVYYYYNFIYPVKDILKFRARGYNIDETLDYDSLKDKSSGRFICLGEYSKYTLMDLNGLTEYFKDFPELNDVVKKLIDLKLLYPNMSDEERLTRVLSNVKSNRSNLSDSFSLNKENAIKLEDMNLSQIYSVKKK